MPPSGLSRAGAEPADTGLGAARWLRFSLVGATGLAVQLAVLSALVEVASLPVALATPLAVEAAIANNFLWHQVLTWRDRPAAGWRAQLTRFATFNATGGAISLVNTTLLTSVLLGAGLPLIGANLLAVASGSILTFVLSDRVVFRRASAMR